MNIYEIIDAEINKIPDRALKEFIVNELQFELWKFIKQKTKEFHSTMEYFEKCKKVPVNS